MSDLTRRDFVRSGAAALAAGAAGAAGRFGTASPMAQPRDDAAQPASQPESASSAPKDELRIGVIGCGGRGCGAAINALEADPAARIVALADLFPDRLASAQRTIAEHGGARGEVPADRLFAGFDAWRRLLEVDLDVVALATPPGFRPIHFAAVIDAGRHAFVEKPVAVCPAGARQMLEAGRRADERGLCVVAGTQRRHERSYLDAMERLRGGVIGTPVAARCFWNMGGLWCVKPEPARSDVENQVRNWLYHTWLSGDHIVEQHVHNIDVVNWAFDALPTRACAVGGRQARTAAEYGHVFDHFAVDYEYPEGRFALSMARQQDGTTGRVEEIIHGTDGVLRLSPGYAEVLGRRPWRFDGGNPNPYVAEWSDLLGAIRERRRVNETRTVTESTLAAIMGRMAAYLGTDLSWDEALAHPLDLRPPADLAFTSRAQDRVAIPGRSTPRKA